jgi:hypothetical protein
MQFDVHLNPVRSARDAWPLVMVVESDVSATGTARLVAPMLPAGGAISRTGRVMPEVAMPDGRYRVAFREMTSLPAAALGAVIGSAAAGRDHLLAAVDFVFFGI